jgi:hypothetical protein
MILKVNACLVRVETEGLDTLRKQTMSKRALKYYPRPCGEESYDDDAIA